MNEIEQASKLGAAAFARGVKSAPCLDAELLKLIPGQGPDKTIAILAAWSKAWHAANLSLAVSA
jgi:hypothetical protein